MDSDSNKEYSVNWKNHMSHVRKAFSHLLDTSELTDVTLYCEGKKIGAHKMLLSACSNYFRDTFKDVPCQHPVIILYGVEYAVLSDILQFIYNGEVSVDTAKLDTFLKTAQLLQISGLTDGTPDRGATEDRVSEKEDTIEQEQDQDQEPEPEQEPEQDTYEAPTPTQSGSEEQKRGLKRLRIKEVEQPREKIVVRQEGDSMFVSDVKCEPSELVNFEDPLEDPLQAESNESKEFFGSSGSQNIGEDEFKKSGEVTPINLLPEKSRKHYEHVYKAFMEWRRLNNIDTFYENVLLAYFGELAEKYKSTSLWTQYSMLKSTLGANHNINIERYSKLRAFLKRKSEGYLAKQAKIFTSDEINRFINDAPEEKYLATKVALIMGIVGGCKAYELKAMRIGDFQDCGSHILVTVRNTTPTTVRTFMLTDKFYRICRDYIDSRPRNAESTSFFLNYKDGRCTTKNIGINRIKAMGKQIATYLKLPNPEMYTSQSFRRSSATLALDAGGKITEKYSRWGATSAPEVVYVDDSVKDEVL